MKSFRPPTLNNAHHKMNFLVKQSEGKSDIDTRVHHVAIQDMTELKDSQTVPSRLLKRASPYSSSVLEAYTGKIQKVKAVDMDFKRQRVEPATLQRKVDAAAYLGDGLGEKCAQDTFYNRLCGYDDTDGVQVDTAIADYNLAGSSEQKDFDSDSCSVGSCSVNGIREDKFSNRSVAIPCLASYLLSSDAESFYYSVDKEEDGSHCLEDKVEVSIHKLELHAYRCTLEALYASGLLTWEKELLLTNLRIVLHISNDEHLSELKYLISSSCT